ncbi:hypothetical protein NESM_000522100 [Novymonas esmeraldas]|uniref:Uncharacterized protein n=1 Tax=Novymonas esmeraldas TaxID=1808958 RepID=A0AAW0EQA5_9TRYP
MSAAPQAALRREAVRQLEALPSDVLSGMVEDAQAQLQAERSALSREQAELHQVERRLAKAEKTLSDVEKRRVQHRRQVSSAADAAARTAQLLRIAKRRGHEYTEAIARVAAEVRQLRSGACDDTASPASLSIISATEENAPSANSSILPHDTTCPTADVIDPPTPSQGVSPAVAASRAANERQQRSVFVHALEHRVARVERENRVLRSSIDVLNRGDASSAKLFHELEARSSR